jgi:hypothetical protein
MYYAMDQALFKFYSTPQTGGSGIPNVFSGSRRNMVGGSFFGTLLRSALPIIKNVGKRALSALTSGAVNSNIFSNNASNPSIGESMKNAFKNEGLHLLKDAATGSLFSTSSPPPADAVKRKLEDEEGGAGGKMMKHDHATTINKMRRHRSPYNIKARRVKKKLLV